MDNVSPLPEAIKKYAESPVFTTNSVPAKLTQAHSTKAGVWGRLNVLQGSLDYIITGPPKTVTKLYAGDHTIIKPQETHLVALAPDTRFQIEFLK